jgi:ABC-type transport system involved in multi-copper enzyme maturation permease subunit
VADADLCRSRDLLRRVLARACHALFIAFSKNRNCGTGFNRCVAVYFVPDTSTPESIARRADIENIIGRISPSTLFSETVHILLNPAARVFGIALQSQAEGILPTPLALGQSLNLIWPHVTTLFGLVAVCFGISYIFFMRAEIRA